jgi:hypothetical protein
MSDTYAWSMEGEIHTGTRQNYADSYRVCDIEDYSIGDPLRLIINGNGDVSLVPATFERKRSDWDQKNRAVVSMAIDGEFFAYIIDGRL